MVVNLGRFCYIWERNLGKVKKVFEKFLTELRSKEFVERTVHVGLMKGILFWTTMV